jgi:DNA-binding NtrC family response regulator
VPFDEPTFKRLQTHRFAGNVRELRNLVESATVMGRLSIESTAPLGGFGLSFPPAETVRPLSVGPKPYKEAKNQALTAFEKRYLSELITHCDKNASEAARIAKMDRKHLLTLLRKHGLR